MSHASESLHIDVTPTDALIDADTRVRIGGARAGELVSVAVESEQLGDTRWASFAHFVADAAGQVDLATAVPVDGSYRTADANRLIWSLSPTEDSPVRIRDSRFIESGLRPFELTFRVETPRSGTAEASILRRPIAEGVERREIRESGVVGTLFTPPGAGPHPAIAVVPGSNGGIPEALGALYASHGYAALALGYFRVGDLLPETLEEIPLEYFDNAFNWLSDQPRVDANRLVVSGASRGGELALLLGATFPTVRGVLAWVPSNTVNQGFARIGDDTVRAAWTLNGEPIPFLPRGFSDPDHPVPLRDGGAVFAIGALRSRSLIDDPEPYEIPVERINGPVLFLSGRDDVLWPSAIFSDWAVSRLREKGFAHEVQHLSYENAGHTLGPANGPATIIIGPDAGRVSERFTNLGGTPEGIARARADLWPRVLEFLRRTVATA